MLSPLLLTPRARAQVPAWNDDLYVHIFALSLSAALAQIFILITSRDYGAPLAPAPAPAPSGFFGWLLTTVSDAQARFFLPR